MAYTTINKSTEHFNTKLHTGNGSSQSITGVGFQPDLIWVKERSSTSSHQLVDAVRGIYRRLLPNGTNAESDDSGSPNDFNSFDSDGFSILAGGAINENTQTYASWNWLANNTSGSSNTDGDITSTVSVNTTSGFSVVSYTGNGVSGATVGHGLGVAPKMIMIKCLNVAHDWAVFHKNLTSNNYHLVLNESNAEASGTEKWQNTDPSANVFTLGNGGGVNANTQTHIAYCFAEKKGFSKFGSYIGNGDADGTFVYTGFKPAFVMVKRTDVANDWNIQDTKRQLYNGQDGVSLHANAISSEIGIGTGYEVDFLSNGFKRRNSGTETNASGGTYIYMAFAEAPLVGTNNVPCTAR